MKGNGPLFSPYIGWESMLEMEGVQCFLHLRRFLFHHEWWKWTPNTTIHILRNGSGEFRKVAIRHPEKKRIIVYFPDNDSIDINMNFLPGDGNLILTWFNPIDGSEKKQVIQVDNMKIKFKPPEDWLEAVLVFEEE